MPHNIKGSLSVTKDILVAGTVDGVDVADVGRPLHGVYDQTETILTINADTTKFDVAPFHYYINGVKYSYAGSSGNASTFTPGDTFVIIGVNASGIFLHTKNAFFSPSDVQNALEIGGMATTDGTTIAVIGNSHYDADSFIRDMHLRTKFVKGTSFLGAAGSISQNTGTPLTLDVASGSLFDPNNNLESLSAESSMGMVGNWHVSGAYALLAETTPFVINDSLYDDGNGLTALPNNKYATHTVMRSSRTGTYYFSYGLTSHDNLGDAIDAPVHLGVFDSYKIGSEVEALAKVIIKKGAGIQRIVDVRNQTSTLVSASTSTLQTTYDRSSTPEIVTDSVRGALTVKGGTGSNADKNISVESNSGSETAYIRASGDASFKGISADGTMALSPTTLTAIGTDTSATYGWRDLTAAFVVRGTGLNNPTWGTFRNGIAGYLFSPSTMKEVWSNFHIDHDYAMGTVVFPHIHWAPNTTSTGTVRWGVEYTVAKGHQQGADSTFGATTTVYINQTVSTPSQYQHFVAEVSLADAIPATLLEPDSVIMVRFFRDAANAADTFPDDVFGFFGDLHYQSNRFSTVNKAPNFFA